MRRPPAVMAIAFVLSGIRTASAAPCAPRARLDGDTEAVARVSVELRRLGVTIGAATVGCPALEAAVVFDGGGIAVAIRDRSRRSEGRVVTDATVAAAWIDSWLRDDFDETAADGADNGGTQIVAPRDIPTTPSVPPSTSLLDRATIAATYERSYSGDGATWNGGSASACIRFGGVCFGGRFHAAFQPPAIVELTASKASRSDLSALATASTSIGLGRMILSPELAIGAGLMTTTRADDCKATPEPMPPPGCDPMTDPTCPPPDPATACVGPDGTSTIVNDSVATIRPRASVAVRIAIPLFDRVWLDGVAAVAVSPFSHGDPFVPEAGKEPNTMMLPLPGEPTYAFQFGVGLRIGAPLGVGVR